MATAKAARYNEILLSPTGALLPGTLVEVRLPNTTTKGHAVHQRGEDGHRRQRIAELEEAAKAQEPTERR